MVYDLDLGDGAKLFKDMTKLRFGDGKRNISNIEFHSVIGLYVIASRRLTFLSIALRTRANDIPRSTLAPIKQVSFGSFPCRTQKMNCAELEVHF